MFTITPEVASLRVFPPRQRLEGDVETTYRCLPPRQRLEGDYDDDDDDDDDDETTYGCLPSRQRSRAYECFHRARGSRVM